MTDTIPTPQAVLKNLDALIPVLYRALEGATHDSAAFFGDDKIDPYLAPCLVRYFAKEYLRRMGHDAHYEQEDVDDLANNGLALAYGDYQIRILKSDEGSPPVPGRSRRKQAFYSQQQVMLYLTSANKEPRPSAANVLVLWDVDRKYHLGGLSIACPKKGLTTKASVEAHWIEPIPHPASAGVGAPAVSAGRDLPIWREKRGGRTQQAQ